MSVHLASTMDYYRAMDVCKQGKHVARKEWMKIFSGGRYSFQDWHGDGPCVFLVGDRFLRRDRHGNVDEYFVEPDDRFAKDWIEV